MIKRRYDLNTGRLGLAYPDNIIVPEPYLTLSYEENDRISSDTENIYFYINNQIVAKNKAEIEAREKKIADIKQELGTLDLKSIRAIRSEDTEYIQKYESEAAALRAELTELTKGV